MNFHCSPHFSKFAVEVTSGAMAGLVPDTWRGSNGFMEVSSFDIFGKYFVCMI